MQTSRIKLSFECNEKWEDMDVCSSGRFCGGCNKVVHDYKRCSKKQFLEIKNTKSDLCGQFAAHQLDPSLYPLKNLVPENKYAYPQFYPKQFMID